MKMISIDSLIDIMPKPSPVDPEILESRLNEELEVFHRTGLDDYFMMFHSLLVWAHEQHMPLCVDSLDGEGSLVLHCLRINPRNPLKYGFGFESFLNLERVAVPWFRIICRPEDVQLVHDRLAFYCADLVIPSFRYGIAIGLPNEEGGIGFLSAERHLNLSLDDLEGNGFVPVVIEGISALSGLSNLDELKKVMITEGDGKTFEMISRGDTEDVYLLGDPWMMKCLSIMRPSCIDELGALMTLYHNGLSDLIPMYMDLNRGMLQCPISGSVPGGVLDWTSGVITCKEQFYEVVLRFAGFSILDANRFWRAVERKERRIIAGYREQFLSMASKFGRSDDMAKRLLRMIDAFGYNPGYKRNIGFWHVLLAYRLAYLKCHFGNEIPVCKP